MKSASFVLDISLPSVDNGEKIIKRIGKILPKGSALKLKSTDTLYADVKRNAGDAVVKEEGTITINR